MRNLAQELRIAIGGIVFSFVANNQYLRLKPEKTQRQFATKKAPEIRIVSHYGCSDKGRAERRIFDSGGPWRLFRSKQGFIFRFYRLARPLADKKAVFKPDFKSGDIYIRNNSNIQPGLPVTISPFEYPLDELLMISLLALGRGVMMHAAGIKTAKGGLLFAGASGRGKSTLARLWQRKRNICVLSDDRIVIRKLKKRFWIYGTPWQGEAALSSPARASLKRIFFLKHAPQNIVRKLPPLEAVSRLIACSFPPFWSKPGMEFTLKFCADLAGKIPCYELGFVPDKTVLDFIRSST